VLLVRSLNSLLFAVAPFDPMTFTAAAVGIAAIALAACIGPALRAVRADPAATLRAE
jgi:ABC-type lipoprotein release transport system permease subunit